MVIINTCGFIDNAKQESIDTILRYADAKADGDVEKVYVTGCLSQSVYLIDNLRGMQTGISLYIGKHLQYSMQFQTNGTGLDNIIGIIHARIIKKSDLNFFHLSWCN